MKTKKIFIALTNYNYPSSFINYGLNLAKTLERHAMLIGIEKMPIPLAPSTAVNIGMMAPEMLTMADVVKTVEPKMEQLKIRAKEVWEEVDYDLEIGFPESRLEKITHNEHPYLVVVEGNRKLDNLNEWFGTYETRLAKNLESPVLVVQKNNHWQPIQNIIYVMNAEDDAVENMRIISDIAKKIKAHITVVFINDGDSEIAENNPKYVRMIKIFSQFLGYDKVTYNQIFSAGAVEKIDALMKEKQSSWLAFQHKDQSFFTRIFSSMNTEHLILQAKIPVLVF